MDLKIKNLTFDAQHLDPEDELARIAGLTHSRPAHEITMLKQLNAMRFVRIVVYDCTKPSMTTHQIDAKGRIKIRKQFKIVGINSKGKATAKATAKLRDEIVSKSAFSDIFAMVADLDARFGSYQDKVPLQKFVNKFGAEQSFVIVAEIDWLFFELKPKTTLPAGTIFAAIPYQLRYSGEVTYDCRKPKSKQPDIKPWLEVHGRAMTPKDPVMRKTVAEALERQISALKSIVRHIEYWQLSLEQDLERNPDDTETRQQLARNAREIKEANDKMKDLDRQLKKATR